MKRITKSLFIALAITSLVAFMGCSKKSEKASTDGEKKTLTYSRSQGPYTVLFESGVKPILEAKGFKISYLGDKMWNAKIVKDNWEFSDGDKHEIYYPPMLLGGTVMGNRTIDFTGTLEVIDER